MIGIAMPRKRLGMSPPRTHRFLLRSPCFRPAATSPLAAEQGNRPLLTERTTRQSLHQSAQPLDRFRRRVFALIRFGYATRKLGTCVHDRCSLRLHCRFGGAGTAITAAFKAYADPASERLFTRRGEHHSADNQCNEGDSNPNGWFHARASLYPSYPWLRTARPHTGMPSARLPRFTGLRSTPC